MSIQIISSVIILVGFVSLLLLLVVLQHLPVNLLIKMIGA